MSEINDFKNRTLTLERTLNAPVSLVWKAWSQSDHIAKWWGPKGMEVKVQEHNFSEGGQWRYAMTMPNGGEFITEGVFSEIVELERIISSADFKPMTEGVEIQALFAADGESTKFTFNVVHPTVEYCQQQEKMGFYNGWASVFDNLKAFVEAE